MNRPYKPIDIQLIFQASPTPYLVVEPPELIIVAVSQSYLDATMTVREEIVGRGIFEIFPDNPDDSEATGVGNLRASLERVMAGSASDTMPVQKYDIRRSPEDGGGFEERYWSPINTAVRDNEGLRYIIHRVEDVTEFMRAMQERSSTPEQRDYDSDAHHVQAEVYQRARTVSDANRRLRSANRELGEMYEKSIELDRLKTQFFANVSHELRTPLTLILGPVQNLIASPSLSPADLERALMIQRNARSLLRLVSDLLDISKLDAGQMSARYRRVDLGRLVRFVAGHFELLSRSKRIAFQISAPDGCEAEVDPDKLLRVLTNLLSNALKFTPSGGAAAIEVETLDDNVVLRVSDSGPGVPPAERRRVFERFQQIESQPRMHGGAGLGLAIVDEFVSLHRGSVDVSDSPLGGALFTVTLPRRAPEPAVVEEESFDALGDIFLESQIPAGGPMRDASGEIDDRRSVLVVEDNADMRQFLMEALRARYRVCGAGDGREGLEALTRCKADLIVTDLMMPVMDGAAFVAAVRERVEYENIPIMVVSARSEEAAKVRLLTRGVQDYLDKPFSVEELMARAAVLIAERDRINEIVAGVEVWRRSFLRQVLLSVTQGKLAVCEREDELPVRGRAVREPLAVRRESVCEARAAARDAAADLGFVEERAQDLMSAVSECAMNAVVHAGGGAVSFCVCGTGIQIWVEDNGPGINLSALPQATLEKGFTTGNSLGHGFFIMLKTADRVSLLTGPAGTTVVLEMFRKSPEPDWMTRL